MANISDFVSKLKGGGARANQFKVTMPFPGFAQVGGETEAMDPSYVVQQHYQHQLLVKLLFLSEEEISM